MAIVCHLCGQFSDRAHGDNAQPKYPSPTITTVTNPPYQPPCTHAPLPPPLTLPLPTPTLDPFPYPLTIIVVLCCFANELGPLLCMITLIFLSPPPPPLLILLQIISGTELVNGRCVSKLQLGNYFIAFAISAFSTFYALPSIALVIFYGMVVLHT